MFSKQPAPVQRHPASADRLGANFAKCLLAAALAIGCAATLAQPAGNAPFSAKRFVYRADGKKLADVLQDFAASQDMPVVVDPGVDGSVNANFNARAEDFLNAMSRTYGVIWYFDGTTLFVYPSRAMQSKVFRMRGYDRNQVKQMLGSLGLGDARFPLRFDDNNQTLLAYGPPRHIELVSTVIEQLERGNFDRVGKSILVVPLHYATAADRSFGQTAVPGLVSTLNDLFSPGQKKQDAAVDLLNPAGGANKGQAARRAAQSTYGMKMTPNSPVGSDEAKREDGARANQLSQGQAPEAEDAERPFFQAEQSSNSIIVRGLPDRMREYEALIHQLDQPQDLVEIEASIIDVNADDFDSLGIDWSFSTPNGSGISMSPGTPATSGGTGGSDTLSGNITTTILNSAGRQLINHIRALEGKGKAHVLARPKVLGAVNRTAVMTDKRVASVRVSGNLDANLFTVEAGTKLQVTPQIIDYGDHREVRLSLMIQDGNFEGGNVDNVPIVKQTEIDTEALVREGSSLLIGGISVESSLDNNQGIPGLSRVPLVGALFRHTETSKSRSERMFLLTPKIVSVAGRAPGAVPVGVASPLPVPAPVRPLPQLQQGGAPAPAPASAVPAPVTSALGLNPSAPAPAIAPAPAAPAVPAVRPDAPQRPADRPASGPTICAAKALGLSEDCPVEAH